MNIYKATVSTPFGSMLFAVESESVEDARTDLYTAAYAEMRMPHGSLRISAPTRSNRRIFCTMQECRYCHSNGAAWAWSKRI